MKLLVRQLGTQSYQPIWKAMQRFTNERDENTSDEIWCLQHTPVLTLGQAGKEEHLLNPGKIPVIKVDRGGQVTYHGPGQLVCYLLIDLRRHGIGAVVGAAVPHHEHLEVVPRLQQHRRDGRSERPARVVGRDDHRDPRTSSTAENSAPDGSRDLGHARMPILGQRRRVCNRRGRLASGSGEP